MVILLIVGQDKKYNLLKERIDSIPPPLEDAPFESNFSRRVKKLEKKFQESVCPRFFKHAGFTYFLSEILCTDTVRNLQRNIYPDSSYRYRVRYKFIAQRKIPAKYWGPSFGCVTGLGNHDVDFKYEVTRANVLLDEYSIGMRFHIADAPVDCILGTPFLSMVITSWFLYDKSKAWLFYYYSSFQRNSPKLFNCLLFLKVIGRLVI
jgi:hypothetical protein